MSTRSCPHWCCLEAAGEWVQGWSRGNQPVSSHSPWLLLLPAPWFSPSLRAELTLRFRRPFFSFSQAGADKLARRERVAYKVSTGLGQWGWAVWGVLLWQPSKPGAPPQPRALTQAAPQQPHPPGQRCLGCARGDRKTDLTGKSRII